MQNGEGWRLIAHSTNSRPLGWASHRTLQGPSRKTVVGSQEKSGAHRGAGPCPAEERGRAGPLLRLMGFCKASCK